MSTHSTVTVSQPGIKELSRLCIQLVRIEKSNMTYNLCVAVISFMIY